MKSQNYIEYKNEKLRPVVTRYESNGSPALAFETEEGEPYITLTANIIGEPGVPELKEGCSWYKFYSSSMDLLDYLSSRGYLQLTVRSVSTANAVFIEGHPTQKLLDIARVED